ncbi:MAG: CRISPR-associated endoribonuclease Cas6 [Coprobacter sp.]|nr:CRISPR-associated endoribonuclease Cas6 [Coprobacter sp.]
MRFKLVLTVQSEFTGNVLPVSYQYELTSCVHRILTEDRVAYEQWLGMNGFLPEMNTRYKLMSVSNLYIPKIKVEEDRLCILAKRVQLWISTMPERGTEEFIQRAFLGREILLGDRRSQVAFKIDEIHKSEPVEYTETMSYLSLSPIVISCMRNNRSFEYIGPDCPDYEEFLMQSILEKYQYFYGKEFPYEFDFKLELIAPPKRKGIFIKRFTREESKVIGYMYKFKLTLHPILQELIHKTGLGDKISLGFGCIEIYE